MKYTTEITTPEFDENGYATTMGWVTVYRADTETGEYLCADMERTDPGFSLSADAYLDAPELPESDDIAVCRSPDGKSWIHQPDYRGKTGYHTQTRAPQNVQQFGPLPAGLTLLKPQTEFDQWDGQQWITDTAAHHQHAVQQTERQRQSLLHEADERIRQLERRKRLEMTTEQEIALLREWEIYSVKLSDVDCSSAPDVKWPEQPK
ncbi:putative tail fiber protein of a prophage [Xenorhabdus nematophila F1]|uniref:tail fiber assembly protein n=1 Tax=Xenorhabdus nematophila TaxID=628 RepID=UPI000327557B|nr:tail fiber assembly protein [Xenorhabdus nematophila]CCW31086.1 putative tail fiber protein of a prophage [Xenorhabdus nematophila F1]